MELGLQQALIAKSMSNQRPKRQTMSMEEATISNMWEMAEIVEVLERKSLCTKQGVSGIANEFRQG